MTCTGAHMHDSNLAPVVQKLDNAIKGINHYPLDSDLSGG